VRLKWSEPAIADLVALREYIRTDNPIAAQQVATRLLEAVAVLRDQPGIGRVGRVPGTRELVVSGTPYIVPYRVKGEVIELLRVLHGARRWPDST
jgi:toxin ParE1/3/4